MTQISYKLDEIPERVYREIDNVLSKGYSDECVEYHTLDKDGYGVFNCLQKDIRKWFKMHRVAYIFTNGEEITSEDLIMHTCDNRRCCNPNHLKKGTPKDNSQDMAHKGRSLAGERNPKYKHGNRSFKVVMEIQAKNKIKKLTEPFHKAKFNLEELRDIRTKLKEGVSVLDIATQHKCVIGTIYSIRNNKTYKHLT